MDQSCSIASEAVRNDRATLLKNCSNSPPAVLAVLEETIVIVDRSSVFLDYTHVKAKLMETFKREDVQNTKHFVAQFLEMEYQRRKKEKEMQDKLRNKADAEKKNKKLSLMGLDELMNYTTKQLLENCRKSSAADVAVLQRAIDVVSASDFQASYRQVKQTLINEFGYSKFEGTKDFIELLLKAAAQGDHQRARKINHSPRSGADATTPNQGRRVPVVKKYSLEAWDRDVENLGYAVPTKKSMRKVLERGDNITGFTEHLRTASLFFHQKVSILLQDFIAFKRSDPSTPPMRAIYEKMTPDRLITRLFTKRPLMFMSKMDSTLLKNGKRFKRGFDNVGNRGEKNYKAVDFLSYDEMQLAALMSVASKTYFINNGRRSNMGEVEEPDTCVNEGWFAGMVGARFERLNLMEWQHMVITRQQNSSKNGYGPEGTGPRRKLLQLWADFYGVPHFSTFEDAMKANHSTRFLNIRIKSGAAYLDRLVYSERLRVVILPFLRHCNYMCKKAGVKGYVHVVGLGLGVWMMDQKQALDMMSVYEKILMQVSLPHISDIDFCWFKTECEFCTKLQKDKKFKCKGGHEIKIHFSKRNPADPLPAEDQHKRLFAQFAWDGNAFVGNEYWAKMLAASGDPAAAACSTIALVQNPDFNKEFLHGHQALFYSDGADAPSLLSQMSKLDRKEAYASSVPALLRNSTSANLRRSSLATKAVFDLANDAKALMAHKTATTDTLTKELQKTVQVYTQFRKHSLDKLIHGLASALGQMPTAYKPIVEWVEGLLTLASDEAIEKHVDQTKFLEELVELHKRMHNPEKIRSIKEKLRCQADGAKKNVADQLEAIESMRKKLRPLRHKAKHAQTQYEKSCSAAKKHSHRPEKTPQAPDDIKELTKRWEEWDQSIQEYTQCEWEINQAVRELELFMQHYVFEQLIQLMQYEWHEVQKQVAVLERYQSQRVDPVVKAENFDFMVVKTDVAQDKLDELERMKKPIHQFVKTMRHTVPKVPDYFKVLVKACSLFEKTVNARWSSELQQSIVTDLVRKNRNYHSTSDQANLKDRLQELQAVVSDFDDIVTGMKQQMGQLDVLKKTLDGDTRRRMETVYMKFDRGFRQAKELAGQLVASQVLFFNEWSQSVCKKMASARNFLSALGADLLSSLPHASSIGSLPHSE